MTEEIIEEVHDNDEPNAKSVKVEPELQKPPEPAVKKNETWNRSIGVISKKPALANLVRTKKSEECSSVKLEIVPKEENSSGNSSGNAPAASGLSLLANYSGSDSDSQ